MTKKEKDQLVSTGEQWNLRFVPIWEKVTISISEAVAYSGIGINKIRELSDRPDCEFVLWIGKRKMIKRRKFDEFLENNFSV